MHTKLPTMIGLNEMEGVRFLQANGRVYVVKRMFPIDGWFTKAVNEFGGEHISEVYGVETIIKDNTTYYLVNEAPAIDFEEIKN
jgi:hypothetical protein